MNVVFWFVLVLAVLPFGIGELLVESRNKAQIYLTGLCASWGLYEIFAFVFHCTLWPLSVMTGLWVGSCTVMAGLGFYRCRADLRALRKVYPVKMSRGEWLLTAFVAVLLLTQTAHVCLSTFYGNWDDSTYCAISTTSWYTNTVNRYSPNTGTLGKILYSGKYSLALWPVFSASLAQLTGVHPAIVFRTLMPVFEVPLAYGVLYLLARFFFPESRKKALCSIVCAQILTMVSADKMGQNSAEWWLMVNPWTGKAVASNIMVPLILWIMFNLEEAAGTQEARYWWRSLFFACLASCLVAGTMYVLAPVELIIWGVFYLVRTRRWKDICCFLVCGAPSILCLLTIYWRIIVERTTIWLGI